MKRLVVALAFAVAGCAPPPGDKVVAQIREVEAEETPDKLLARGRAFAAVGDMARAEQYFAAALNRGGDPRVVLPLLLRACAEERRYRAAIDYAEPVLKKHPNDYRLRFVVASFYATIGETASAREELERIVKERPDFAPVHYALAVLLRDEAGDVVSADAHFREYLRIDPRGAHAEEAKSSLLKLVDHGGAPVSVPPVWRDVNSAPKDGKATP
ncbi:MAG: tetratricopeptide repeat protein [Minicystis sp.]